MQLSLKNPKSSNGYVLKNTPQDLEQYFSAYGLQTTEGSKEENEDFLKDANNWQ